MCANIYNYNMSPFFVFWIYMIDLTTSMAISMDKLARMGIFCMVPLTHRELQAINNYDGEEKGSPRDEPPIDWPMISFSFSHTREA